MESTVIQSLLYRASLLGTQSVYLRGMVQAAAKVRGIPYTDEVLWHVATTPTLAGAVELRVGEPVDEAFLRAMIADPAGADALVTAAVAAWPPAVTA